MKRRCWFFFGGVQITGALVGLGASHVDTFSWIVSLILLLPGSLVSALFFAPGRIGNAWPKWTIFAIAAAANLVFFAILTALLAKRKLQNVKPHSG